MVSFYLFINLVQYTRLLCWQVKMSSLWLFTWHLVTNIKKKKKKQQNTSQQPFEFEKVCVWRLRILGSVSMMKSTFLCSCRSVLKDCAPKKKSINNKHILMVDLSEKKILLHLFIVDHYYVAEPRSAVFHKPMSYWMHLFTLNAWKRRRSTEKHLLTKDSRT